MDAFVQSLDEFYLLAMFARDLKSELRLCGSVARAILSVARAPTLPPLERRNSMLDYVPAFADIDLVTETRETANQLRARIDAHMPHAHFFRWDIRVRAQQPLGGSDTYVVYRENLDDEIAFGDGAHAASIRCCIKHRTDEHREALELAVIAATPASTKDAANVVGLNSSRTQAPANLDALVELLTLARRFPSALDGAVGRGLKRVIDGSRLLNRLNDAPGSEALPLAAVELAFGRDPTKLPEWFRDLCTTAAMKTHDADLRELFLWCAGNACGTQLIAIVRPEEVGGRSIRRLYAVRPLSRSWMAESREFLAAMNPDAQSGGPPQFVSPIAQFDVGPPSHPCCEYRDFDRGLIELAWRDPNFPALPISSNFAIVDLSEDDEVAQSLDNDASDRLALAHVYTTFSNVGMMRADYGFLSVLASRGRTLRVIGGGSEIEEDGSVA